MRLPEATEQVRVAPIRMLRAVFSGIGQLLLAADRFRDEEAARADSGADAQFDPLREESAPAGAASPRGAPPLTEDMPVASKSARHRDSTGQTAPGRPSKRPKAASQGKKHPKQARQALDREAMLAPKAKAGKKAQSAAKAKPAKKAKDSKGAKSAKGAARAAEATGTTRFRSLDSTGNVRVLTPADIAEPSSAPAPAPPPAALPVPGYDDRTLPSLRSRLRYLDAAQLRVLLSYEKSHAQREDVASMFQRRIAKLEAAEADAS